MIQIVSAATYGLLKDGIVRPMTKDSGPFETSAEAEARLVAQGHAEYVGSVDPIGMDDMPPEGAVEEEAAAEPRPLEDLTAKELRALGKEYGLTFKVGMTKAEMIAQIEEAQMPDEDDGEDAPSFDAAEAVV